MILEPIESINKWLLDQYGKGEDGRARVRVVWSHDEMCKQYTEYSPEGFLLQYKVLLETPKYRQWADDRYILEILTEIPEGHWDEMAGLKVSYEPLWVFQTEAGDALPPKREAIEAIMFSREYAMSHITHGAKYKSSEMDANTVEATEHRVDVLMKEMYGNETSTTDALAQNRAVGYTGKSKILLTDQ